MFSLLVLLSLSASITISTAPLSKLSKELVKDGLVTVDTNGLPTTVCMVSLNNGASRIQLCPMTEGFGPRSVGCFAVWNSTGVMAQGCYSNQEISMRDQCTKRACTGTSRHEKVAFCCCHGPLCNAAYTPV